LSKKNHCHEEVGAYGDSDTLMNQSNAGIVTPTVKRAINRRKRKRGKGDWRIAWWLCSLGAKCILMARDSPSRTDRTEVCAVRRRDSRCSGNVNANAE